MNSKPVLNKLVSLSLLVALPSSSLLLTGCANTADGRTTQAQGAGIGALGGAALGYLVGGQRGAAIGALVGGAAGFAYGSDVAKRKAKYARAEQWLNEEIAIAHQANAKAYAYNRNLKARIAVLERRIQVARASQNKAMLSSLKSEVSQISDETRRFAESQKKTNVEIREVMRNADANSASNFKSFEREASAFEMNGAETGRLSGRVANLRNSLDR